MFYFVFQIISKPKQRTSRWVSTSVPKSEWNTPLAQTSSAAYHVNNLLNPVLFKARVLMKLIFSLSSYFLNKSISYEALLPCKNN